ncbi:MAG: peptidase MA family metallohydrolase [Nitrospirota bacterium]|nr:peptidase MA family metallohydrolase [Nitrospirota bacterium]MDP2381168.1 peptidase MA family metallohydrolase [Nitrospirota bacterium]MDP3596197.1 peptidase MA family metallohydrolase [Nitrospirota bacterium]
MYRRNIGHILYPIACLLGLFIVYQAWFKPTYLMTPPPSQPETVVERTTEAPPEPHYTGPAEPEQKQTRLIDPSVVPDTTHHELLETIRDEIERGNIKSAETKLAELPPAVLSGEKTRPYVAVLWNNLGIQLEKAGGTSASVYAFRRASTLDDKNPTVHLNLAHAFWELRDPAMTQSFLEKLVALAPNEAFPHLALAELFQERDRLGEAARHLDQATARAGKDPAVQSYLKTVTAKVRRTEKSDARLTSRDSTHFTVKFDGEADQATWVAVLEILEEAYREIGQRFGHFPSKPIVVVLHAHGTFQSETGSPAWADGLFDPVLGRIQIPTQNALVDRAWLKRVLRHEFVHALLHDQQGPASSAFPTWLNEGLAMDLSEDRWSDLDRMMKQDHELLPLPSLEGAWGALPAETVALAYLEANSAVRYLIDRFGMHQVHGLLSHLKAGQALSAAMQSQLSLSYEQFQSRWLDQLQVQVKKS